MKSVAVYTSESWSEPPHFFVLASEGRKESGEGELLKTLGTVRLRWRSGGRRPGIG